MKKITVQVFKDAGGYVVQIEKGSLEASRYFKSDRWTTIHEFELECILPNKKIKKTIERWANVYEDAFDGTYLSKNQADACAMSARIACVKLTGEYEMEE